MTSGISRTISHSRLGVAFLVGLCVVLVSSGSARAATQITGTTIITQPGEYHVTADFTGCVDIQASNVHLNLGGHTIAGPAGCFAGVTIDIGATNVHVNHGTVTGGFEVGVFLAQGANNNHVNNIQSTNNEFGIFVSPNSNNNLINGNTASNNGTAGIAVFVIAQGNLIVGNTAQNNGSADMLDGNPNCDANKWVGNTFGTANQPCIQ